MLMGSWSLVLGDDPYSHIANAQSTGNPLVRAFTTASDLIGTGLGYLKGPVGEFGEQLKTASEIMLTGEKIPIILIVNQPIVG